MVSCFSHVHPDRREESKSRLIALRGHCSYLSEKRADLAEIAVLREHEHFALSLAGAVSRRREPSIRRRVVCRERYHHRRNLLSRK